MKAIFLCEKEEKLNAVFPKSVRERIRRSAPLSDVIYTKEMLKSAGEELRDVCCIFSTWGMTALAEEEIRAYFPNLKYVFYAAGTVQKFARPFLSVGVRVFSAWAANAVPVAEFTVSEIILANKGFFASARLMKEQKTEEAKERFSSYPGNFNTVVGLLGCGMIGSMVAERLKDYRLRVIVFDPFLSDERAKELNVERRTLEEVFRSADVISNHLANNEETRGMLKEAHFASMKRNATFLNTGRGATVEEEGLVSVLEKRPDLTAVLDVTHPEPPERDHPFYRLPNVVLSPHIAGSSGNEVIRMAEYMADEFERVLAGEPCRYEVTEKMLKTMA